ncbi:glycyl-radical enzyme activating protein [Prolixibacteraceae bacterium JC049]|nr:glycyl-radical enzyme activating protein [Prolixibacteraceae bacterium JC049]
MSDSISYFGIDWLSKKDGPGKRVVLFLQGCPLDCAWCHSPHSQPQKSPLLYFESLCINCNRCMQVCPNSVHQFHNNLHTIDRTNCTQCGKCIEACPQSSSFKKGNALVLPTKTESIEEIYDQLEPQLELLSKDGGITFSGGEPLLQVDTLIKLAAKCKSNGFHTALETSGIVPLKSVQKIAPYIDTWLFGMRLTTGTPTISIETLYEKSLSAFQFLKTQKQSQVIVRIPSIYNHTDTPTYLKKLKQIIADHPKHLIDVLPANMEVNHYYTASGKTSNICYTDQQARTAYQSINECLNM